MKSHSFLFLSLNSTLQFLLSVFHKVLIKHLQLNDTPSLFIWDQFFGFFLGVFVLRGGVVLMADVENSLRTHRTN